MVQRKVSTPIMELARLRSSMWSSETLVRGMESVNGQRQLPDGLLVKTEEDVQLSKEYWVTCTILKTCSFLWKLFFK